MLSSLLRDEHRYFRQMLQNAWQSDEIPLTQHCCTLHANIAHTQLTTCRQKVQASHCWCQACALGSMRLPCKPMTARKLQQNEGWQLFTLMTRASCKHPEAIPAILLQSGGVLPPQWVGITTSSSCWDLVLIVARYGEYKMLASTRKEFHGVLIVACMLPACQQPCQQHADLRRQRFSPDGQQSEGICSLTRNQFQHQHVCGRRTC